VSPIALRRSLVAVVVASVLAAACSSAAANKATPTSTHPGASATNPTTTSSVPGGPYTRPACVVPARDSVQSAPVPGSASDFDITSFDKTLIRVHWFPVHLPPGRTAPTVLKGPGWGQPGDTNTAGSGYGLFGDLSINTLNHAGYNVLTWDPRGFGQSGGTVETDSPSFEGRDVEKLIDWVATRPGVELDGSGDPRVGMVGASYGGGIQLAAASIDCRIDAIVPQLAWHSLGTSLYDAQTAKTGWGNELYAASSGHSVDPHITSAHADSDTTGVIDAADVAWFESRGPGNNVARITAPTLFEQGTIDTLFPLEEAVTNYQILRAKGVPTAMLWMCSGHGVCLTNPGDQQLPGTAALAWLARYLKEDVTAKLGPPFEYVDQNGVEHTAAEFPPPSGAPVVASGHGTLTLTANGGSGPATASGSVGALGSIALPITPARAANAVNVAIGLTDAANIVGAPQLTLQYSGTTPPGARPTRAFAQLVDDATGIVLGTQITPIMVTLDGHEHTTTVPLEIVAFTAKPGSHLTLQLVATTVAYAPPRLGGSINFRAVRVTLPTVTGVTG
jgi:ABC-2 type transport system ATP-binding protein